MMSLRRPAPRAHCIAGFSYVEVLLAIVLLAVCIGPAMDAIRDSLGGPSVTQSAAQALQCVKNHMEKVVAEPYRNLASAAGSMSLASPVYSLPGDTQCGVRNVYLSFYDPTPPASYPVTDTGLIYVTVASPGTALIFSTLVTQ